MTSFRWYLVDALIRWLIDNKCTPYLVIKCDMPGVQVPQEYVQNNQIILNVSAPAVSNFSLGSDGLEFDTRFKGVHHHIRAPAGAIIGVHAKEGNYVVSLDPEIEDEAAEVETESTQQEQRSRPKLKFVD